jgi:glycosyltransferase involved in cell wall biosynthesis
MLDAHYVEPVLRELLLPPMTREVERFGHRIPALPVAQWNQQPDPLPCGRRNPRGPLAWLPCLPAQPGACPRPQSSSQPDVMRRNTPEPASAGRKNVNRNSGFAQDSPRLYQESIDLPDMFENIRAEDYVCGAILDGDGPSVVLDDVMDPHASIIAARKIDRGDAKTGFTDQLRLLTRAGSDFQDHPRPSILGRRREVAERPLQLVLAYGSQRAQVRPRWKVTGCGQGGTRHHSRLSSSTESWYSLSNGNAFPRYFDDGHERAMRVLVLSKRQYTGKDLLDDRYGRLFEIPAALATAGHDVRGLALSYRRRASGQYRWSDVPRLSWHSANALPMGLIRHASWAARELASWRPQIIWASSDALQGVLGARLATSYDVPLVIDLYDNYESFGLTRLPGLKRWFRLACRRADGLSIVSRSLAQHVAVTCAPEGRICLLGNGVDGDLFKHGDREASRRSLGLPTHARLIGTAGAITAGRGIGDLFEAFVSLADEDETLWLVIAGPRDGTPAKYRHPRIIDLGMLPWVSIPLLFNSLDVAVVCNRDSEFGRYCFPMKLQEMNACGVPVVAAAVGDVASILETVPNALYPPGDAVALAAAIRAQLAAPSVLAVPRVATWHALGQQLGSFFREVLETHRQSRS